MPARTTHTSQQRNTTYPSRIMLGYYSLIGLISFGLAGWTVISGGTVAGFGHHLSALHTQKAMLENQRQELTQRIAAETSLAAVSDYAAAAGLEEIEAPFTLSGRTAVAQR